MKPSKTEGLTFGTKDIKPSDDSKPLKIGKHKRNISLIKSIKYKLFGFSFSNGAIEEINNKYMKITIEGIKIDGNKQLDKVIKFEKELIKIVKENLNHQKKCVIKWDSPIIKKCTFKKKYYDMAILEGLIKRN